MTDIQITIPYTEALAIAKAILGISSLERADEATRYDVHAEATRIHAKLNAEIAVERIGGGGGYGQ